MPVKWIAAVLLTIAIAGGYAQNVAAQSSAEEKRLQNAFRVMTQEEQAQYRERLRVAETEETRERVRAEIHERAQAHWAADREIPAEAKKQMTEQERAQVRKRLIQADGEENRNRIRKEVRVRAEEKRREMQTRQRMEERPSYSQGNWRDGERDLGGFSGGSASRGGSFSGGRSGGGGRH